MALRLYLLTYNCAQTPISPTAFSTSFFSALPTTQRPTPPDILVLSLQEIAPIAYSFIGGSYLAPYLSLFEQAVELASNKLINDENIQYDRIITRNVGQTAVMVFARRESAGRIRMLEFAGVGVGMVEMGNKGAVGVRMRYSIDGDGEADDQGRGDLGLTFVAAHLAPMEDGLARRNRDWEKIVRGLIFTPARPGVFAATTDIPPSGFGTEDENEPLLQSSTDELTTLSTGIYTPEYHVFLAGDLNYRTSDTKPGPHAHDAYPQPTTSRNSPQHYSHLFKSDQLTREIRNEKTCHGFSEAPLDFPPSYKFSSRQVSFEHDDQVGKWEWARHRYPSWCDRILFLPNVPWPTTDPVGIQLHRYIPLAKMDTSDHRPVALSVSVPLRPATEPREDEEILRSRLRPPFAMDPQWREKRDWARRREIVVGVLAYIGYTWEGNRLLLATLLGGIGGWLVLGSLIEY